MYRPLSRYGSFVFMKHAPLCQKVGKTMACSFPSNPVSSASRWTSHFSTLSTSNIPMDMNEETSSTIVDDPVLVQEDSTVAVEDTNIPGFTADMTNGVELFKIFKDFAFYFDVSWKQKVHALIDGPIRVDTEFRGEKLIVKDDEGDIAFQNEEPQDLKVTLYIPLSTIQFQSQDEIHIFKELAGPRYNERTKEVKLTCNLYPTRVFNHKQCCNYLRDLIENTLQFHTQELAYLEKNAQALE